MIDRTGTHVAHCCIDHGCKYGDAECPVELAQLQQESGCEWCDREWDEMVALGFMQVFTTDGRGNSIYRWVSHWTNTVETMYKRRQV